MHPRKLAVLEAAHELFMDRGFQATSIQDILDKSNIAKGTFYNYFSSKNELLLAIFREIDERMRQARLEVTEGRDRTDPELFIQQIMLQMRMNRQNKLISLYEEVMMSHDEELKAYIQHMNAQNVYWLYVRFVELFGEAKRDVLLDCAMMFIGILQQLLRYHFLANGVNAPFEHVIRYSFDRLRCLVNEASTAGVQLMKPSMFEKKVVDTAVTNEKMSRAEAYETLRAHVPPGLNRDEYEQLLKVLGKS